MIISHSKRFVFLANRKTASTSIGIALSSACNQKDVITPLGRDETIRKELGYRGPQNFIPVQNAAAYQLLRIQRRITGRSINNALKQIGYHTHMTASQTLQFLPEKTWNSYFRFCFVRNPWDRAISQYFWHIRNEAEPKSLDTFINGPHLHKAALQSREMYCLNGELAVNRLCRYENAQEELDKLFAELGLEGNSQLPNAKRQFRQDKRSYREILNDNQAARIAKIFEQEIALTGYCY